MIRPWNPYSGLSRIERAMNSMFSDFWRDFPPMTLIDGEMGGFPVDVIDQDDTVLVRAELPGVDKENIDITCSEDTVSIAVEKKEDRTIRGDSWVRRESSFGKAARIVRLESTVDPSRAEASLENGVLTVRIPKTGSSRRGHKVRIQ